MKPPRTPSTQRAAKKSMVLLGYLGVLGGLIHSVKSFY
jgi:hypothetical protein